MLLSYTSNSWVQILKGIQHYLEFLFFASLFHSSELFPYFLPEFFCLLPLLFLSLHFTSDSASYFTEKREVVKQELSPLTASSTNLPVPVATFLPLINESFLLLSEAIFPAILMPASCLLQVSLLQLTCFPAPPVLPLENHPISTQTCSSVCHLKNKNPPLPHIPTLGTASQQNFLNDLQSIVSLSTSFYILSSAHPAGFLLSSQTASVVISVLIQFDSSSGPFSRSVLTSQHHPSWLSQNFTLSKFYFSSCCFSYFSRPFVIPFLLNLEMLESLGAPSWTLFRPLSTHSF